MDIARHVPQCNHAKVDIFNDDWTNAGSFATRGFGRGFAISRNEELAFIGTSKTRKQYAGLVANGTEVPNMIQAFRVQDQSLAFEVEVPCVEQVNNVYSLDDQQYERLRRLN